MPLRDFSSVPLAHLLALFLSLTFTTKNSSGESYEDRESSSHVVLTRHSEKSPDLTIPYDVYVIVKQPDTPLKENLFVGNTIFHFLHIALTMSLKFLQLALIKLPIFYSTWRGANCESLPTSFAPIAQV